MALKLFRRKSKAPKEPKAEVKADKKAKVDKKIAEVRLRGLIGRISANVASSRV